MITTRLRAGVVGVLVLGMTAGAVATAWGVPVAGSQASVGGFAASGAVATAALPPTQLWVDPRVGNDAAAGSQVAPLRTISAPRPE